MGLFGKTEVQNPHLPTALPSSSTTVYSRLSRLVTRSQPVTRVSDFTTSVIMAEPVYHRAGLRETEVAWLELPSERGPCQSRLRASTTILGSMVLTDAIAGRGGGCCSSL